MNDEQNGIQKHRLIRWVGRRILSTSAAALTIVVVTTLAGFFARHHWLADLYTNLRMQQVIGLIGVGTILAIGRHWKWVVIAFVTLCVHVPWFASALVPERPTVGDVPDGQRELVVMTLNVLTSNRQHDKVLQQIETASPDVFTILELGTPLHERLEDGLSSTYPYRTTLPQDGGNFGIGLYSKHPLTDVDSFSTNIDSILSIGATVTVESAAYRIIATHPLPPIGRDGFQSRNEHLQMLGDRVAGLRRGNGSVPVVVMGDLNLTPWSPLFGDFESRSGLKLAQSGQGIIPTWYAKPKPIFPFGLVLDHVLLSDDLQCVRREVGGDVGSDHRAVIVTFANRNTK
ncbi:endonuclease/exonuclease/phosphatase family protein [Mariniblastus fucicola]|uniref:endonuclease/exonuclease/phosphatase family protein n=1 Tax=Mariniblastus fucicola TaxID=980251 RepID=UPI0012FC90B2|nr:endonuclease/exonuclease/phosphatase family protein [Mariniblastus fucicola]